MTILKYIGTGIAGVVVGLLLAGAVQTNENVGGVYNTSERYFPAITVGTTAATSSTNLGRACITMTETDGGTIYWYAKADGNLGTTTYSSCVR